MKSASLTSGRPARWPDSPCRARVRLVADHQRGLRVDGVGVGQPRVHDPLDELLVGAGHLGRQRHPHALHQRPAADEPARVEIRARQPRRQHLQRAQLLVGDLAVRPRRRVTGRTGSQTLRSRARTSTGLRIWASTIASSSASCGFIWRDAQCAASVSSRRFSVPSSSRRVSSTVHITVSIGQLRPDQFGLGGQERVVEADVVGDERAVLQHVDQVADDVAEARLALEHFGGQAVHMGGPGVDAGVEQRVEAALDVAVVAERQGGDADDAGLPGAEAGGLDVDDGPARAGVRLPAGPRFGSRFEDGAVGPTIPADRGCRPRVGHLKCRGWSPLVDVSRWRPGQARDGRRGSPGAAQAR